MSRGPGLTQPLSPASFARAYLAASRSWPALGTPVTVPAPHSRRQRAAGQREQPADGRQVQEQRETADRADTDSGAGHGQKGRTYRMCRMPKAQPHRVEVPTERPDAIEACL
jgi:hypothetical protein